MKESLYRRVLGASLDSLPDPMRQFHDSVNGGTASGRFKVSRGAGVVRNILASLMGLPQAGDDVPLELTVTADGVYEDWSRSFAGRPMKTRQWQSGDMLIEAGGPMRFAFKLTARENGLDFEFVKAWFCLIPLPRFASPRIEASETPCEDGWNASVQMSLPMLGPMIRYEGRVTP